MAKTQKHIPTTSKSKTTDTEKNGPASSCVPKRPIWEVIVELGAEIPEEEWAKVPDDASINLKHYLYGAPKQSL